MNNIYTSRLYQPLQATLDKSIVSNPQLQLAKSRMYEQAGLTSRLSRRMRAISPEQAKYIKSSTFIPTNKELVPTGNLWKVRGKQFTAVNVQVKQGPPIPASALRFDPNLRGAQITTQTVYQALPKQPQIRSFSNTRSITNLRTIYPPTPNVERIVRMPSPYPQAAITRRTASPVRVSNIPSIPVYTSNVQVSQPMQSMQSIQSMPVMINQMQQSAPTINVSKPNPTNEYYNNYYGNQLQQSQIQSKSHRYKYNLFSAFDEAVNTKCGSCGANQIIATKPFSSWQ